MGANKMKMKRNALYEYLVEYAGHDRNAAKVLSFEFQAQTHPGMFHYRLKDAGLDIWLFDAWRKYANVIVDKDSDLGAVVAVAQKCGGVQLEEVI